MTEDTTPTDDALRQCVAALTYYRDEYTGAEPSVSVFARMVDDALAQARASLAPSPAAGDAPDLEHVANEWADMATNGLQWIRNIAEGISTPADALANMERCLRHCYEVRDAQKSAPPAPSQPGVLRQCRDALAALLKRDERNTCQHEETHRGGVLWTICDSCGQQWADDEGGMPKWEDPPEWGKASAALAAADAALSQPAPATDVPQPEPVNAQMLSERVGPLPMKHRPPMLAHVAREGA